MPEIVMPDQIHRYTVDEYEALEGHPSLDVRRVELIDGFIVDMTPRSPSHENVISWLHSWLFDRIDRSRYELRVASSLRLATSEPEQHIYVTDADHPRNIHPTTAHLVIEVAVTSLRHDLQVKPAVYAPAVDEYWVVNLLDREVVVHRDPGPRGYREIKVHPPETSIAPRAIGLEPLPFGELFAPA